MKNEESRKVASLQARNAWDRPRATSANSTALQLILFMEEGERGRMATLEKCWKLKKAQAPVPICCFVRSVSLCPAVRRSLLAAAVQVTRQLVKGGEVTGNLDGSLKKKHCRSIESDGIKSKTPGKDH